MVTRADALLMLSNSGETAELADLITYGKRLSIPLIGVANNAESKLLQASDVALLLPKAQEACPMGLAPTTSTTMMLALGDALAVALMERRGFSAEQYRDFHPGGSLGKKLIRVSDVMHKGKDVPLVRQDTSMKDVLIAMTAAGQGFAGVVGSVDGKGSRVGIITDCDLRRHMERGLLDRVARDVMSRNPKTVPPSMLAAEALAVMNDKGIARLFVVEPGDKKKKPQGIIFMYDCLRAGLS